VAAGDSSTLNLRYVALAKYRQKRYMDAIPYLYKLYQSDTTNIEIITILGNSLSLTYDRQTALQFFDKAEKLMYPSDEEKFNLSLMRADTYVKTGDKQNAQKYYWEAYKLSKNKIVVLTRLVSSYYLNSKNLAALSKQEYEQELLYRVLYLREIASRKTLTDFQRETKAIVTAVINLYLEDLFFKDIEKVQISAPDGQINLITRDELTRLLQSNP
jgi:tetratricopeptide (TPR) repeat protein